MSHIIEILKERETILYSKLCREFQRIGAEFGEGFSFPCKKDGSPDEKAENYNCWIKNFHMCLEHPEQYEDRGIEQVQWEHVEPALVRCSCGREMTLDGNTRCVCGQWYNQWGKALLSPQYPLPDDRD